MDNLSYFEKKQLELLKSIKYNTNRSAKNLALWTWLIILIPVILIILFFVGGLGLASLF